MLVYNGSYVILLLLSLLCLRECKNAFVIEEKYYLVTESYNMARNLFNEGRLQYDKLKDKSRHAVDTFLDLVHIMNEEMARELRTAIVKFYKIKYFHDFTNYAISMEEKAIKNEKVVPNGWIDRVDETGASDLAENKIIIDISEHCLIEPLEKLKQIREHFHHVIKNFEDVRNFNSVDKCADELPDEVAAAHCVLHQAVLFNETMHESLATIVEIKMRQHAQDMNSSLYGVQKCLNDFVPKFFDQLLVDAYTPHCDFLKVVNASIGDLSKVKWKRNETLFSQKWSPLVKVLKEKAKQAQSDPLFLTLFAANLTSYDIGLTMYK